MLGHLTDRVVLIVANGAKIFENNQLIQVETWDDELVEKALTFFEGQEVSESICHYKYEWWIC